MDYATQLRNQASEQESGRTSSVYSDYSEQRRPYIEQRNGSGIRHTYTPSYMSNHAARSSETSFDPQASQASQASNERSAPIAVPRKPIRPPPDAPEASTTAQAPLIAPGALLVLAADTVHSSTINQLEILLSRQSFASIVFAAHTAQEAALKQLRMDTYALLGKLQLEISIYTELRESWGQADLEAAMATVGKSGAELQGILCCPQFEDADTADADVLALSEEQLAQSWRQSVAFVHNAAKATTERLLSRCRPHNAKTNGVFVRAPQGPFFLVAGATSHSSASQMTKAACDALIYQLESATKSKGLTVGYAETMLVPEPKIEPPADAGNGPFLRPDRYSPVDQDVGFTPSESPTKLWNMWALQNDIGFVE